MVGQHDEGFALISSIQGLFLVLQRFCRDALDWPIGTEPEPTEYPRGTGTFFHPRRNPQQYHALLAYKHGAFQLTNLLGKRRKRSKARRHLGSRCGDDFPWRGLLATQALGRAAYPNLIYYSKVDRGGHFAAWEEPELFSAEVRAAFKSLR